MSKNARPICPDCGKPMAFARAIPSLPHLNIFRCARCKIAFTEYVGGKPVAARALVLNDEAYRAVQ